MNPHLDNGLVACALLVILAIIGIGLWLYGAGHLDQIDRPHLSGDEPTAAREAVSQPRAASSSIRDVALKWGAKGSLFSTRTTATPPRGGTSQRHPDLRGRAAPAHGRGRPRRIR